LGLLLLLDVQLDVTQVLLDKALAIIAKMGVSCNLIQMSASCALHSALLATRPLH
jgi:hypothetical protein